MEIYIQKTIDNTILYYNISKLLKNDQYILFIAHNDQQVRKNTV